MDFVSGEVLYFIRKFATNWKTLLFFGGGTACLLLKKYFAGGVCESTARLDGKTALVTGGNTGVGKETARDLASRGARVILACRNRAKAEAAAEDIKRTTGNNNVVVRIVELDSLESVRKLAKEINETEPSLHLLINNAGLGFCPHWKSKDGYEWTFAVNHLSHFLLTNLLLDKLTKSSPSRIVNVSSLAHKFGEINFDDINLEKHYTIYHSYGQSKLANVLFTRELHRRLEGSGVTSYVVHPGSVRTEFGRYVHLSYNRWLMKILHALYIPLSWVFFKTSPQGAQTSIYCAVSEGIEVHSGKYFSDCHLTEPQGHGKDDECARKLWDISEKMVNLK